MHSTRISSSAAIALFIALKDNNKLKRLNIVDNAITDDALNAITIQHCRVTPAWLH